MFNQKPKKGLDFLQKRGLVGRFSLYRVIAGGVFITTIHQLYFYFKFFWSGVGPDTTEFI